MIDRFNRNIEYLRISVTDRCNLRCIYCMPENSLARLSDDDILMDEELVELARIAVCLGLNKLRITGGEPLLRDGIVSILRTICAIEKLNKLSITTNGVLLKEKAESLYEAGLREINLSMDTLRRDRFLSITKKDLLPLVLEGMHTALKLGFSVKLNVVVIRGVNDDELLDFARLIERLPVFVRFIELMPIGNAKIYAQDRFVSIERIKAQCGALGILYPIENRVGSGPAIYYRFRESKGALGFIGAISQPFCNDCNRLRLTSRGFLRPCLSSDVMIDLKPYLRPSPDHKRLEGLFKEALLKKPMRHTMNEQIDYADSLTMCHIGG